MIINMMEQDALSFMEKRKKVEEKRKEEMIKNIALMSAAILSIIKNYGSLNVSLIPSFVSNEIMPIIDEYRNEQRNYVDSFIRDDYEVGINTANKIISLSNEQIEPIIREEYINEYEEVLAALLLYADRIVDGQFNDLEQRLVNDLTSIYIANKNMSNYDAEKDIDTNNYSTLNIILGGSIISRYINPSFNNINNRTKMTSQNETNRALNHGLLMTYLIYKRDKKSFNDLRVKWVEVKDNKVCKHCKAAAQGGEYGHGVYDINDVNPPPLHSRCRCILIPYMTRWGD
jgi:hypothetical protein